MTVYVTDEQLALLKERMGGASKAFQAFVESLRDDSVREALTGLGNLGNLGNVAFRSGPGTPGPHAFRVGRPERAGRAGGTARYDFARRVMPNASALDRLRLRVAKLVEEGGPPAEGGPVDIALAVLAYKEAIRQQPELEAELDAEFARFGLDVLMRTEAEGFDAAVDAEVDVDVTTGDDDVKVKAFRIEGGELKDLGASFVEVFRTKESGAGRNVTISVSNDDDPGRILNDEDLATFRQRHPEWAGEGALTDDQLETISELLRTRFAAPGG